MSKKIHTIIITYVEEKVGRGGRFSTETIVDGRKDKELPEGLVKMIVREWLDKKLVA